jgi:muramoyltetrapeptide carboxypeptidase
MRKKFWSILRPSDTVDIIAPASQSTAEKLSDGVRWVESIGLKPRVPTDIIKTDLYFASRLENQIEDIKNAIYSDSKAIWCLRGGYGSMRLIPHLLKLPPPKKPKLFVGFSDITSLHLFFTQHWNWPVIHGRTISQMHPDLSATPDRKLLTQIIFGKKKEHIFKQLKPLNHAARSNEEITGVITGGNLRIIQSSLKTSWELKAKGKILFIEDVGERGYSIDRMLEQMIQAGIINTGLKAIIFGDFTESLEKDGKNLTETTLDRFAKKVSYPVLRGIPAGHNEELNYPVPFHTECVLRLGRKNELICSYGGK